MGFAFNRELWIFTDLRRMVPPSPREHNSKLTSQVLEDDHLKNPNDLNGNSAQSDDMQPSALCPFTHPCVLVEANSLCFLPLLPGSKRCNPSAVGALYSIRFPHNYKKTTNHVKQNPSTIEADHSRDGTVKADGEEMVFGHSTAIRFLVELGGIICRGSNEARPTSEPNANSYVLCSHTHPCTPSLYCHGAK